MGRSLGIVQPAIAALLVAGAHPARAQEIEALRGMSIEDLQNINVSSVSKTDMPLSDAAAAIYVISREDILRSGAATIPEMLRLAPNLQVYEVSPSNWVVTARGLNGNKDAQSFSNKLLVLIDGRTVYTPLFSGVYWDLPDVLPDDIDRIEVISGPGATLWGANAVNGVINIITRRASETKGFYADLRAGPDRQALGARIAGQAGDDLNYEVHGRFLHERHDFGDAAGTPVKDGWRHGEGGFRLDWTPRDADLLTLQGDLFSGRDNVPDSGAEDTSGGDVTLRWNRQLNGGGEIQAQAFYDRIERDDSASGGGKFRTNTYDAEVQHNFTAGSHSVVWGGGARWVDYSIEGTSTFFFVPPHRTLFIANAFAQDSVALTDTLTLIGGLKAERLPYAGTSLLPEVRLAWKPAPAALVWGSVERAVRSPTPFDEDVQERVPPLISLAGNPLFTTEKLTAFELGTRLQPASTLSLSLTGFYHLYDDLRSVELVPGPLALNLSWSNNLQGHTYGFEAWGDWRVAPWWTLAGGATVLWRHFTFKPGGSGLLGPGQDGTDPPYTIMLRSSMNPLTHVTFDLDLRAVGKLRDTTTPVPAYRELGGRLAWQATRRVTLSVSGTNLLHARHLEYPSSDFIPRRIMGGLELRY
ncbi:MAG: TonB-dependent receptor [Porphyrobacter sp.]|nr:TonB-dependent receptor [Porphyrobacter sp.]